ncbi:hypothetical protein Fmac_028121 [Flemingia macrophylla]|uniref:Phosphate transporter PHO1 n=1 Tax=Flemingia macrophylla TaxID=520843 RepID=A0ABD1LJN5_9FABA
MVKFSKELEAQLIPEWKEAFVNYRQLKKHVKRIKLTRVSNQSQPPQETFGRSVIDSLRFITNKLRNTNNDNVQDIIQVRRKMTEECEEVYETELAQLFSEEDEMQVFFAELDGELNKVNQFYKKKESEFVERGEMLNKQLNILLDLKQVLSDRRRKTPSPKPSNTGIFPQSPSQGSNYSESIGETNDDSSEISEMDEVISTLERNGLNFVNSAMRVKTKKGKPQMAIRIDIPATTPTVVTSMLWEDLVNSPMKPGYGGGFINKRKIQCAEKMIRSAFVELYKGLGLLKTYSSLNMVAFSKILKKFDKVSCQRASANYLKEVKRSHFISSDKVVRLMDEVESIFTTHFANNDRKKAMKFLRPQQPKASHMTTFLVALKHTDAFLMCTTLMTTVFGAMVIHLLLRVADFSPGQVDAIPGILFLCARRWLDDGDVNHLTNMGKYVSAMIAAGARVTYSRQDNHLWFAIVLITSVVATIYQLYWDFVMDWGFFKPNSKNPWLRDDLILKRKNIYYMSILLNVVLRVAWVETIMHFKVGPVQTRLIDFLLASLEVIRRGHWNFYRLENEHLNNVGHFRAVKAVPLPFREIDSDS